MPKRAKFNHPVRRDLPQDDNDFVEVSASDIAGSETMAAAVVSTSARAIKGAAAAAIVTAAMNYAESAAVSYTLETVGVTAIAKGAYVRTPTQQLQLTFLPTLTSSLVSLTCRCRVASIQTTQHTPQLS